MRQALHRASVIAVIAVSSTWLWMALTVHFNYQDNWTALFCIGERMPSPPQLDKSEHLYKFHNSSGYDGQFYHDLAHDPTLTHGSAPYIDAPRFRQRRILLPALVWVFALGQRQWIDRSYFATMLAFLAAGVYWLSRYAQTLGRNPWWGLLYLAVPSTIISIDRMTTDLAFVSLFMGFVYFMRQRHTDQKLEIGQSGSRSVLRVFNKSAKAASPRRHTDQKLEIGQSGSRSVLRVLNKGSLSTLWLIAATACLTRETGLCIVAGYAACLLWRRQFRTAAIIATSAVPLIAWDAFITVRTPGGDQSIYPFHYPGRAILEAVLHPNIYPVSPTLQTVLTAFDLTSLFAFLAILLLACTVLRRDPALGSIAIAFVTLALISSSLNGTIPVFTEVYSYGRVFSPVILAVVVDALTRRSTLELALFAIVSLRSMLMVGVQALGILRAVLR